MTNEEYLEYFNDRMKAERLYKKQLNGETLPIDVSRAFRLIQKRKWDAELYNIPYEPVLEEVLI